MSVAVVHLVREGNDPAHLERFIHSYRQYDSGLPHQLVLMFKGFQEGVPPALSQCLEGIDFTPLTMPDEGYDISAYLLAAKLLGNDCSHLLFLNSYSEFLGDGWLNKLYAPLRDGRAGATGATGSWGSHYDGKSDGLLKFFSTAYEHYALYPQEPWLRRMALARLGAHQHLGFWRSIRYAYFFSRNFDPFPNPHLRSNGFMIRRDLFLQLKVRPMKHKFDAYAFECGRDGLSKFLLNQGLHLLVVGLRGETYKPTAWSESKTFWSSSQENLLIADNRTRQYETATPQLRLQLQHSAWGKQRD